MLIIYPIRDIIFPSVVIVGFVFVSNQFLVGKVMSLR